MTDTQDTNRRIADRPTPEPSPSAGWRATAAIMHVTAGLEKCVVLGCDRDRESPEVVDETGDVRREDVRCSDHAKDFLEVSS